MITRNNPSVYADLFDKANKALNYVNEDGEVVNPDYIITNIDDYFTVIKDLAQLEQENGLDPIFTILPADEETFDIDANTRKIKIPNAFTGGAAVQGDEISETIYFSIDRYFDITDLYDKEIFVQWTNASGEQGLSITYNKSLSFKPGKVVFGWPLTSEITRTAGPVQFAVRFYDRKYDEQHKPYLAYSFSTLTSTIRINPALDIDITDEENISALIVDKTKQIYDILKNSTETNITTPAAMPEFEADWSWVETPIDLDERGERKITAKAHVPADVTLGIGTITYSWSYIDKNNRATSIADVPEYQETTDTSRQGNDVYYYQPEANGSYQVWQNAVPSDEYTIYERNASIVAKNAGKYAVTAVNTYGRGNSASSEPREWIIPFAVAPTFEYTPDNRNIILNEASKTIRLVATSSDNGVLTYKWYYSPVFNYLEDDSFKAVSPELKPDLTTNEISINEKGRYYLEAINKKNNDTTSAISLAIRVTDPVATPVIMNYKVEDEAKIATEAGIEVSLGGTQKTIGVEMDNTVLHDNFTYQWHEKAGSIDNIIEGATSNTYVVPVGKQGNDYYVVITNNYNNHTADFSSYKFVIKT